MNYPIFYEIQVRNLNSTNEHSSTLIYENKEPKTLRQQAFDKLIFFAKEIILNRGNISSNSKLEKNFNFDLGSDLENNGWVYILSFGFKTDNNSKSDILPIAWIGNSLNKVDNQLKANLIIENILYDFYKKEKLITTEVKVRKGSNIKNCMRGFIGASIAQGFFDHSEIVSKFLYSQDEQLEIIPTFQFSHIENFNEDELIKNSLFHLKQEMINTNRLFLYYTSLSIKNQEKNDKLLECITPIKQMKDIKSIREVAQSLKSFNIQKLLVKWL